MPRPASFTRVAFALFGLAAGPVAAGCSTFFPTGGGNGASTGGPPPPTGCSATAPHIAPGGYYVNGNSVCTASGHAHLFHGVDRPSLEWSPIGDHLSADDFSLMATWNANVVRIALNQDFWLSASPYYSADYATLVDSVVGWAEAAGLDVILDLHWSDTGVLGSCASNCQQQMADANSLTFWSEVAARYQGDGRVLFELYNEPHDIGWGVWKSGGDTGNGWRAVGMQQLYDAVRATGADNLVLIGGLDWAFDLSGVPSNRINGYNIIYATHPYGGSADRDPQRWDTAWGNLSGTDPVMATEFGDRTDCTGSYSSQVIAYAAQHHASWSAWGWYPGGCSFPALITDWSATPSAAGAVVMTALGGSGNPAPDGGVPTIDAAPDTGSPPDASTDADVTLDATVSDPDGATD